MFGLGQCGAEHGQLFRRKLTHIRIIHHRFSIRNIAKQGLIGPHFFDHRPQVRIFLSQFGNIARALRHLSLDELKPLDDLL